MTVDGPPSSLVDAGLGSQDVTMAAAGVGGGAAAEGACDTEGAAGVAELLERAAAAAASEEASAGNDGAGAAEPADTDTVDLSSSLAEMLGDEDFQAALQVSVTAE